MKKLLKGMIGVASLAAVAAGTFYGVTKYLEGRQDDLEEDFDFPDDADDSREYVTLDFDEEGDED